jgi:hypothetical protein
MIRIAEGRMLAEVLRELRFADGRATPVRDAPAFDRAAEHLLGERVCLDGVGGPEPLEPSLQFFDPAQVLFLRASGE